jgi:hypothetical protein
MRSICNRVVAPGALVLASLLALPASAAQYIYTVTGVTSDYVFGSIYGLTEPTLPLGVAFTATFTVDDALPTAFYTGDALQSSAKGGGEVQDGSRPPVAATLQIGSYSYTVRQGNYAGPTIDPNTGDPTGESTTERDAGYVSKNLSTGRMYLSLDFVRDIACCGEFFGYSTDSIDMLELYLLSPAFASAGFGETGTFTLEPQEQNVGVFGVGTIDRFHTGDVTAYAEATIGLTAMQLTVSAIPEPAGWATTISGMALMAGLFRRLRRHPADGPGALPRG